MELNINTNKLVLVTGWNGFIGSSVVQKPLHKGLIIHVTLRDLKITQNWSLKKMLDHSKGAIKLYKAVLLDQGSFKGAIKVEKSAIVMYQQMIDNNFFFDKFK